MAAKKLPAFTAPSFSPAFPMPLSLSVAVLLRDQRRRRRMSQEELAACSGVSRQMLSYIERRHRKPTLDLLARLCNGLKISISQFIRRAEALLAAPAGCRECHYSCLSRGRLVWLNPRRGCTRPGR